MSEKPILPNRLEYWSKIECEDWKAEMESLEGLMSGPDGFHHFRLFVLKAFDMTFPKGFTHTSKGGSGVAPELPMDDR